MPNTLRLLIPLTAGAVSALGFAPLDWWPLTILGVAVLFGGVERSVSLRAAAAVGWWFGVGHFTVGLFWIATAFTYQAAMPAFMGVVTVVML
jgi:apolipoprotein N-acyltransferase